MKSKNKNRSLFFVILVVAIIVILYLVTSYFTKHYVVQIKDIIDQYYVLGIVLYLFLGIIDALGVPISNVPLIPVIISGYGFALGTFLTVLGWFIGSFGAFRVARKYGVDFVSRFISLDKIEASQGYLHDRDYFISILFFRVTMPHDFVNYGYGIFTKIKESTFLIASLVGITLSVIIYAYVGTLPLVWQLLVIFVSIIFVLIIFWYLRRRKTKKYKSKS